jgi:hypothetical protein
MNTTIENKVSILSDVWMTCRDEVEYAELFEFCDIAFPLSFCIQENIVVLTDKATLFLEEAFDLLLEKFDIAEDTGFENLDELLLQYKN